MATSPTAKSERTPEFKIGWHGEEALDVTCPLCQDLAAKTKVLEVTSHLAPHSMLDLFKCTACASCFYFPIKEAVYSSQSGGGFSSRFSIELGAGIDSMIRSLNYLETEPKTPSFLDVGCGVGFLADFVKKQMKWDACGIDPSPAAAEGRKLFGDFIFTSDIADLHKNESRTFDIVYASEVVEHVEDPLAFIQLLRRHLSDNGVLVLTTPDAASIDQSHPFVSLLATLSPGFHVILFSEQALGMLLRQAGFKHIEIVREPRRLFAYASDAAIKVDAKRDSQEHYLDYLTLLSKTGKSKTLKLGALYRLFKEYVNSGDFAKASETFRLCEEALTKHFNTDLEDTESIIACGRDSHTLDEFGENLPYCICGLLYYKGMNLLGNGDPLAAVETLQASFQVASLMLNLAPAFLEEPADLMWNAKLHEGFAKLVLERRDEARVCFNTLLDAANAAAIGSSKVMPSAKLHAKCLDQLGISYFQEGLHEKALFYFDEVLSKFKDTADESILDESQKHAELCRTFIKSEQEGQVMCAAVDVKDVDDQAGKGDPVCVASNPAKIHFAIDLTWSDEFVIAVQGWMFSEHGKLENPTIKVNGHCAPIEMWHPRPDVPPFFPGIEIDDNCGFWVYIPRRAHHEITVSACVGESLTEIKSEFTAKDRWLPEYCTTLGRDSLDPLFSRFVDEVNSKNLSVLEIGSRIVSPGSISKRHFFNDPDCYTGFDFHLDENTDICGDAHKLSEILKDRKFDAVFSFSVLEHIAMPWVVAREIALVLNLSGITYHQTPFAWPEHDRPCDYWRFSDKGLMALFPRELGWEVIDSIEYMPVSIHPFILTDPMVSMPTVPGFATSSILVRKVLETDASGFKWLTSADSLFGESYKYPLHEH